VGIEERIFLTTAKPHVTVIIEVSLSETHMTVVIIPTFGLQTTLGWDGQQLLGRIVKFFNFLVIIVSRCSLFSFCPLANGPTFLFSFFAHSIVN